MKNIKIKIIGMGRFGTLLASIIKNNFPKAKLVENVEDADIVFPCVPISAFEEVIKEISPKLKKGALVMDVCSVKVHPVHIMKKYLPKEVEIIATHPLFGPDSAGNGLAGLKIMLYNVSASLSHYKKVKKACEKLQLNIVEMTPDEHDRLMAYSQIYTHFVGRIGKELNLAETPIDTVGFKKTLEIQQYVVNDSEELFVDMNKFNPYSKAMREQFLRAAAKLDKKINLS
jgi:prephenate dehydrogenase